MKKQLNVFHCFSELEHHTGLEPVPATWKDAVPPTTLVMHDGTQRTQTSTLSSFWRRPLDIVTRLSQVFVY